LNNKIVGKYFNIDLDLNINSSIQDLKTAVLNRSNEWTNGTVLSFTKPTFKINKMYYGTPASCNEIEGLHTELSQPGQTLIDVYQDYYKKLHRYIIDIRINRENGTYRQNQVMNTLKTSIISTKSILMEKTNKSIIYTIEIIRMFPTII